LWGLHKIKSRKESIMKKLEVKSFSKPDEVRTLDKGKSNTSGKAGGLKM